MKLMAVIIAYLKLLILLHRTSVNKGSNNATNPKIILIKLDASIIIILLFKTKKLIVIITYTYYTVIIEIGVFSYASKGETIYPREFMGTGTIADCSSLENGHLLKDGDIIRLEIDQIGFVENMVKRQI